MNYTGELGVGGDHEPVCRRKPAGAPARLLHSAQDRGKGGEENFIYAEMQQSWEWGRCRPQATPAGCARASLEHGKREAMDRESDVS